MFRIGFEICYAWKNLIYETPSRYLQGVSDSLQIRDLGSLLKYISCYCSTININDMKESNFGFKYISCYCSTFSDHT